MPLRTSEITPTHSLLLSVLRSDVAAIARQNPSGETWKLLLPLAAAHRIAPLTASHLRQMQGDVSRAPSWLIEQARVVMRNNLGVNMIRLEKLDRYLAALREEGIRAVVLKGASLVSTAYASAAERFFADLDILVARREVHRALTVLRSQGLHSFFGARQDEHYLRWHFHVVLGDEEGTVLELHWGLVRPDDSYWLAAEGVLSRSIAHGNDGWHHECLEDQLLHGAAQFLSEGGSGLLRICDAHAILQRHGDELDWPGLAQRAEEGLLTATVDLLTRLAVRMLGGTRPAGTVLLQTPPSVFVGLEPLRPGQALLTLRTSRDKGFGNLLRFWLLPGARWKILRFALVGHPRDRTRPALAGAPRPPFWKRLGGRARRALRVGRLALLQLAAFIRGKKEKLDHL